MVCLMVLGYIKLGSFVIVFVHLIVRGTVFVLTIIAIWREVRSFQINSMFPIVERQSWSHPLKTTPTTKLPGCSTPFSFPAKFPFGHPAATPFSGEPPSSPPPSSPQLRENKIPNSHHSFVVQSLIWMRQQAQQTPKNVAQDRAPST